MPPQPGADHGAELPREAQRRRDQPHVDLRPARRRLPHGRTRGGRTGGGMTDAVKLRAQPCCRLVAGLRVLRLDHTAPHTLAARADGASEPGVPWVSGPRSCLAVIRRQATARLVTSFPTRPDPPQSPTNLVRSGRMGATAPSPAADREQAALRHPVRFAGSVAGRWWIASGFRATDGALADRGRW